VVSYLSIMFSSACFLVLLTSATFANTTFAKLSPPQQKTPSTATIQQQQSSPTLHLVKITSPAKGQQVPVGKDLAVSGTSVTNKTADCKVSVKVNFINPYHDASPIGVGGNNDYSKWNFTLSPAYTTIKPGQNKITAKFACANDPALASHYSVNVTGVGNVANVATAAAKNSTQQQISSVTTPLMPTTVALNSTTTNATNSTRSPVSSAATFSPGANSSNLRALSVSVLVGKNSLHPGDKQTLTTNVADKTNSTNVIAGASVSESIANPSGVYKKIEGTTDDHGKASYSWTVSHTGTYKVVVDVSAPNYEKYSTLKTFKVTSKSTSGSDSTVFRSISENNNNDDQHSTIETSTSENTNTKTNTHDQLGIIGIGIVGNVNKIHINGNTLSNINSGNGISSGIGNVNKIHINTNTPSNINSGSGTSSGTSSGVSSGSDSNSIGDNHKGNGGGSSIDMNANGLAQKIINNVKNKLKTQGIHLP
jgi:hypothetical protein